MEVSLRQAHKIVEKITARLTTFEITATKRVNVWELTDAAEAFESARDELANTIDRHRELVTTRQLIRNAIRDVNAVKIDSLVAHRKGLLDLIASMRSVIGTVDPRAIATPEALTLKVAAMKESSKTSSGHYGSTDEVTIGLLDTETLALYDQQVNAYQLAIEATEDQLTHENAKGSVVLEDDIVDLLREEGIVA